jgi:opacity protein-like surface antigen
MDERVRHLRGWIGGAACAVALAADPLPGDSAAAAEPSCAAPTDLREGADPESGLPPTAAPDRRFYVTGMLSSSIDGVAGAASGGPLSGDLFAGDGAAGVSIARPLGAVRLELEGRVAGGPAERSDAAAGGDRALAASVRRVTTANVWRDVPVAGNLGAYAGGGLGVGHAAAALPGGGLAWQAGGGVTYAATERVTFDLGYRLHGVERSRDAGSEAVGGLVMAVRIYEPFRGWLR